MNEVLGKRLLGACALVAALLLLTDLLPAPRTPPPVDDAARRVTYDLVKPAGGAREPQAPAATVAVPPAEMAAAPLPPPAALPDSAAQAQEPPAPLPPPHAIARPAPKAQPHAPAKSSPVAGGLASKPAPSAAHETKIPASATGADPGAASQALAPDQTRPEATAAAPASTATTPSATETTTSAPTAAPPATPASNPAPNPTTSPEPAGAHAPADTSTPAVTASAAPAPQNWFLQIGAFAHEANAKASVQKLQKAGIHALQDTFTGKAGKRFRVRCGPYGSREQAEAERVRAAKAGFGDARVGRDTDR